MTNTIMMRLDTSQHMKKIEGAFSISMTTNLDRGLDFEYEEQQVSTGHKFSPETIAIRDIRMRQEVKEFMLPQREFQETAARYFYGIIPKITQSAWNILQEMVEEYLGKLAAAAYLITVRRKSTVLVATDVKTAEAVLSTIGWYVNCSC